MTSPHISPGTTAELLPCPFCGGAVEMTQRGTNQLTIKCGCGITRTQKVLRLPIDWLRNTMTEKWNTRAGVAQCPARDYQKEIAEEVLNKHFSQAHTDMVGDEEYRAGYIKGVYDLLSALSSTERRDEIQPHIYSPDYQAMGDCRVCGHGADVPWHPLHSSKLHSGEK